MWSPLRPVHHTPRGYSLLGSTGGDLAIKPPGGIFGCPLNFLGVDLQAGRKGAHDSRSASTRRSTRSSSRSRGDLEAAPPELAARAYWVDSGTPISRYSRSLPPRGPLSTGTEVEQLDATPPTSVEQRAKILSDRNVAKRAAELEPPSGAGLVAVGAGLYFFGPETTTVLPINGGVAVLMAGVLP